MDNIFDGREVFSDSFLPVWCKLQCISTIFSDRRPCCLAKGVMHSVYKEIIDAMLITQI